MISSARRVELRPKPGSIYHDNPEHSRTVVTRVSENANAISIYTLTTYFYKVGYGKLIGQVPKPSHRTIRIEKYLCVNGPFEGETRVVEEAPGYVTYNRSGRDNVPKVVLVHRPALV